MILDKIKNIINENFGIDKGKLCENTDVINDLKLDSLDIVDLVMALEEEWDMVVPDEEIEGLRTLGDIASFIEKMTA